METAPVIVVGPFDGRDLGDRRIEGVASFTEHADGRLKVTTTEGDTWFDVDEWADVRWDVPQLPV